MALSMAGNKRGKVSALHEVDQVNPWYPSWAWPEVIPEYNTRNNQVWSQKNKKYIIKNTL